MRIAEPFSATLPRMRLLIAPMVFAAVVGFFLATGAPRPAWAGERAIGQLAITDAGTVNNLSTATKFGMTVGGGYMLQAPDAGVWFAVDGRATCNPGFPCVLLPAGASIDTSAAKRLDGGINFADAGTATGLAAMCCESGVAACVLNVFSLDGTEP